MVILTNSTDTHCLRLYSYLVYISKQQLLYLHLYVLLTMFYRPTKLEEFYGTLKVSVCPLNLHKTVIIKQKHVLFYILRNLEFTFKASFSNHMST